MKLVRDWQSDQLVHFCRVFSLDFQCLALWHAGYTGRKIAVEFYRYTTQYRTFPVVQPTLVPIPRCDWQLRLRIAIATIGKGKLLLSSGFVAMDFAWFDGSNKVVGPKTRSLTNPHLQCQETSRSFECDLERERSRTRRRLVYRQIAGSLRCLGFDGNCTLG